MPDNRPVKNEIKAVEGFDSGKLKHVQTEDKSQLPTKEGDVR